MNLLSKALDRVLRLFARNSPRKTTPTHTSWRLRDHGRLTGALPPSPNHPNNAEPSSLSLLYGSENTCPRNLPADPCPGRSI
jgi:hypothetical protein